MRCVFEGTTAFLGRIEGETRCSFWVDEPIDHDFDASKLIPIDLGMTPNAAVAAEISWDAVQVDDCLVAANGSFSGTTIGPRWPEMSLVGLVYLEKNYRAGLADDLRPPCPPTGAGSRGHEFTTVVYWPHIDDPRAGKRYVGHHARLLEQRGSLARLALYPPGTSERASARASTMWIDLESADQCDAGLDSLTQIGGDTREGAVFLIANRLPEPPTKEAT